MNKIPDSLWLQYIAMIGEAMTDPSVDNVENLKSVTLKIVRYAPGRAQVHRDVLAAETSQNWEVFGVLSSVLRTQRETAYLMRELYGEAKKDFDSLNEKVDDSLPPLPLGFTHRWHPQEVIWPNNDTCYEVISLLPAFKHGYEDMSRQAFRAVYKHYWNQQFSTPDGQPVRITQDSQGWTLRKEVLRLSQQGVQKMMAICPEEITRPCTVFDGAYIFSCEYTEPNPFEANLLNAHIAGRESTRATHTDEIWLFLPHMKLTNRRIKASRQD